MFAVPGVGMGGVPIAMLGGVFAGGLPLAGPVTELFRGGAGPIPPTLFASTITPAGPIEAFLLGAGGAPIGVPAGLLPPPAVAVGPSIGSLGGIGVGSAAIGALAPGGGSPIGCCL